MYDRDTIELALLALEEGMSQGEAAELAGVARTTVGNWERGRLPHARSEKRAHRRTRPPQRAARMSAPDAKEGPLNEVERAAYEAAMTENMLLRAVLDDLKGAGSHPASMSNRRKCELGERLRAATGRPLREITAFLRISRSSYEYWRARLSRPDKHAALRGRVRELFEEGGRNWGYRTIWARLRREGRRASEKVVRRLMREEGLEVVYNRRRRRGWSSYEGEVSAAPPNLVARDFSAAAPDELWVTDVTEFRVPAGKVYLSAVVDCYDGRPAGWRIGPRPTASLANGSLLDALAARREGARTVVHSDRGGHYRWPGWIAICGEHGLARSMSAKGCSPDNAACEGFFGRLKNEFFHYRDWEGVSLAEFSERLDAYLRYYCSGRIKRSLGWLSPDVNANIVSTDWANVSLRLRQPIPANRTNVLSPTAPTELCSPMALPHRDRSDYWRKGTSWAS